MVPLQDVRMVTIQFSFTNPAAIPAAVRQLERETVLEHIARQLQATGEQVIGATENCYVALIEPEGFELVDALYQKRVDRRNTNRTYHMVRFILVRSEFAAPSEEFKKVRVAIYDDFLEVTRTAFWRVRAFLKPFYKDGEEVAGQRALSINLEARVPLYHPDGSTVMARPKDGNGKPIGPLQPLQANLMLTEVQGEIRFL